MKNDERAPEVALTDAEREAVLWAAHGVPDMPRTLRAVERIVAVRTADAAARLAAVEAEAAWMEELCWFERRHTECSAQLDVHTVTKKIRAALSTTAPDAGQREAQERAEVLLTFPDRNALAGALYALEWQADLYATPPSHATAHYERMADRLIAARADRSPEQP